MRCYCQVPPTHIAKLQLTISVDKFYPDIMYEYNNNPRSSFKVSIGAGKLAHKKFADFTYEASLGNSFSVPFVSPPDYGYYCHSLVSDYYGFCLQAYYSYFLFPKRKNDNASGFYAGFNFGYFSISDHYEISYINDKSNVITNSGKYSYSAVNPGMHTGIQFKIFSKIYCDFLLSIPFYFPVYHETLDLALKYDTRNPFVAVKYEGSIGIGYKF